MSDSGVGWRKLVRLRTKKPVFAVNWCNRLLVKRRYCFGMLRERTREVMSSAQGESAICGYGLFKTMVGMA